MGKIKDKKMSLKWSFFIYLPICLIIAFLGSFLIGHLTNELQSLYERLHAGVRLVPPDENMFMFFDTEYFNVEYAATDGIPFADKKYMKTYFIISNAQVIIIPLWVIFSVAVTGKIFYKRELQQPIGILLSASQKISENQLDFTVEYKKKNELGQLCMAFDEMRKALDSNNRKMWRSMEERKRLNSAFSHDLRTPLTVLKGYNEFLQKYSGKISCEKSSEILSKMETQIERLENYTYKMSSLQKLEDITPNISEINPEKLRESIEEIGKYICREKEFELDFQSDMKLIFSDNELIMEVFENLVSNAERYAHSQIIVIVAAHDNYLTITVKDDGNGFSEKSLRFAAEPFYREDKVQNSHHFGLGLYICSVICEKCNGELTISNGEKGGKVSAKFFCKSR